MTSLSKICLVIPGSYIIIILTIYSVLSTVK